ncbi:hypothetical protein D3C87_1665830 [compost metagenome]
MVSIFCGGLALAAAVSTFAARSGSFNIGFKRFTVSSTSLSGIINLQYTFNAASALSGSRLLFKAAKLILIPGIRWVANANPKFMRFNNEPVFIQY